MHNKHFSLCFGCSGHLSSTQFSPPVCVLWCLNAGSSTMWCGPTCETGGIISENNYSIYNVCSILPTTQMDWIPEQCLPCILPYKNWDRFQKMMLNRNVCAPYKTQLINTHTNKTGTLQDCENQVCHHWIKSSALEIYYHILLSYSLKLSLCQD